MGWQGPPGPPGPPGLMLGPNALSRGEGGQGTVAASHPLQKGEPGLQGAQGFKGEKGEKGTAGPAGTEGPVGPRGSSGRHGPPGNIWITAFHGPISIPLLPSFWTNQDLVDQRVSGVPQARQENLLSLRWRGEEEGEFIR